MSLIQVWKHLWQELLHTTAFFDPIIAFLLLLFSLLFLFKLTKGGRPNAPPSPARLPIIGNLHQLGKLPHHSLHALANKYGPLMIVHVGSVPNLVVSSAEMAREVLKTHEPIFINRPRIKAADVLFSGCADLLFSPYGEYWRQARKLCVLELLSLKRVLSFEFVRVEEVTELVEKIRCSCVNGSSVNLGKKMLTISNNIVSRSVLGQKYEGENGKEGFGELSKRAMDVIGGFFVGDLFPYLWWMDFLNGMDAKLKKTAETLHSFLDQVIKEHKLSKSGNHQADMKDFVDIMLHLQNNDLLDIDLTRDNFNAILLDMLIGGTDSSAATMEWVMAELVKSPTKMKKAQEEVRRVVGKKSKVDEADVNQMDYLKCVVKETLRLHCPFVLARESTASVTLAGYDIPPKTRVLINIWAIQRDPALWDSPEEFVPERFVNDPIDFKGQDPRFCPFGSGRRGCPGITYAAIEIEYVIANLLYWFDWNFPAGVTAENLDMDAAFQQVNRKNKPLILVPVLHTP